MTLFQGQDRQRTACISCHRRKICCVRVAGDCNNCLQGKIPCRKTSSVSEITTAGYHRPSKPNRRGPYRKGKTPREKELEDIVRSLTVQSQLLETQLETLSTTGLAATHVLPFGGSSDDGVAAQSQNDIEAQYAEQLSIPVSSPTTAQLSTDTSLGRVLPQGHLVSQSINGNISYPGRDQIFQLWHVYMARIEPLIKLVPHHSFTEIPLLTQDPGISGGIPLLVLGVCLAAVSALSVDEVVRRLGETKDAATTRFITNIQALLALPGALQQPDTSVLQALVLYAHCLHEHRGKNDDEFLKTFQLALRVARIVAAESEDSEESTPYGSQVGRRCWWTLYKMWSTSSGGPDKIFVDDILWSAIPLPQNVNDVDLSSVPGEMPMARSSSTDMSFFLVNLEVKRLIDDLQLLDQASESASTAASVNARRKSLVDSVVTKIERDFLRHCDTSRPLDWFLMLTTKALLNPIEIRMLDEGIEKTSCFGPALNDSKEDRKFLLRLDVIECWHLLRTNESLKPWRWFLKTLPQAFSLDDLQAELLLNPQSTYSDRARALIDLMTGT